MIWTSSVAIVFCLFIIYTESLCYDPMGVEDGSAKLTASSENKEQSRAECGRLNKEPNSQGGGGWCADHDDTNPWIQADLGAMMEVNGIITQNNYIGNRWVKSYKVNHSVNGNGFETIKTPNGDDKIFQANTKEKSEVTNNFASLNATFIRINPVTWKKFPCLRFEILGCAESLCQEPMGVEDGLAQLTASSNQFRADRGRLNTKSDAGGFGAWCAGEYDSNPWIQADLGAVMEVNGVITQKNFNGNIWVDSYKIKYSISGINFKTIKTQDGNDKIFPANSEAKAEVINNFTSLYAKFIRMNEFSWKRSNNNAVACLRFEILGCPESVCREPMGVEEGLAQLTASSETNQGKAERGRLNTEGDSEGWGAWCADSNDNNPWIQADLGAVMEVNGIITQKSSAGYRWVESYKVNHSVSGNGFETIKTPNGDDKIFPANFESKAETTNSFEFLNAQFIRIIPVTWGRVSTTVLYFACLRFEILGCPVASTIANTSMKVSTLEISEIYSSTRTDLSEMTSTPLRITADEKSSTSTDQSGMTLTTSGIKNDEKSSTTTDQSGMTLTTSKTDEKSSTTTDQSGMTLTTSKTDEKSSTTTDQSVMTLTTSGMNDEKSSTSTDQSGTTLTASKTDEKSSMSTHQSGMTKATEKNSSEESCLSTDAVSSWDNLLLWIKSQEYYILQQLTQSQDIFQSSAYSIGLWIGNKTSIQQYFKLENNQTASASVQVSANASKLVIVFIYNEVDDLTGGLTNGVLFDDKMSHNASTLNKKFLISGVMSVSIFGENTTFNAQVEFTLPVVQLNESLEYEGIHFCSFYDTIAGNWSTAGCYVIKVTENAVSCFCSHLTSFAVLMQVSSNKLPERDEVINSWITTIGLSLSVVTLTVNLFIYLILRNYKMSLRHKIHINFVLCMLCFNLVFLTAINNNSSKSSCKFVAVLLHYLVLCMFMCMLAEAIFLVIKVLYNAVNRYKLKHHLMLCYLPPICIVAIVAAISHDCYSSETLCWLRSQCRLAVVIPAMLIIGVNIIVLSKMVYVIYTRSGTLLKKPVKIQKEYKQLRNAVRGSFVLFPILGVTWILGAFVIDTTTIFFIYLYNILNSLQGVFVFVVFCLLDNEIKDACKKRTSKWRSTQKNNRINVLPVPQQGKKRHNTLTSTNQETSTSTTTTFM